MPKYLVIKVDKCRKCNGSGVIEHPAWHQFWCEMHSPFVTEDVVQDWFHDNGWKDVPPEEVTCPACHGTGEYRCEVPITPHILSEIEHEDLRKKDYQLS
jgi:DnaJ-class molecular chaperone